VKVLHVGCGGSRVPEVIFPAAEWSETRLDIDPSVAPDIVASITDLPVADGSVHAVYSAHNLEHLAPHHVPIALAEFRRVLAPGGFVMIAVPDLQQAARRIADGEGHALAYDAPSGPVTAFDIVFGWAPATANNPWMSHRCGFTLDTLHALLCAAGFKDVVVRSTAWQLEALGVRDGNGS
jgi:predicted SAM-dependent methyltransferase